MSHRDVLALANAIQQQVVSGQFATAKVTVQELALALDAQLEPALLLPTSNTTTPVYVRGCVPHAPSDAPGTFLVPPTSPLARHVELQLRDDLVSSSADESALAADQADSGEETTDEVPEWSRKRSRTRASSNSTDDIVAPLPSLIVGGVVKVAGDDDRAVVEFSKAVARSDAFDDSDSDDVEEQFGRRLAARLNPASTTPGK